MKYPWRHGSAAQVAAATAVSPAGMLVTEEDTGYGYIGDGSTHYNALKRLARMDDLNDISWYVVATSGASALARRRADTILPASSGVGAALQGAFTTGHPHVMLLGPTCPLDSDAVIGIDNARLWSPDHTEIIIKADQSSGSSVAGGGLRFTKGNPTSVTVAWNAASFAQGSRTLAHTTTGLPGSISAGDWIQLVSTEVHNVNRPAQFLKGEVAQVLSVSTTTLVLASVLRDTYDTSLLTLKKLQPLSNIRVKDVKVSCNPSTTQLYDAGLTMHWVIGGGIDDVEIYGGAAEALSMGIALWGCQGVVVNNPYTEHVAGALNTAPLGHGVSVLGSSDVAVLNQHAYRCRHATDISNGGANTWPQARNVLVKNGNARYTAAAAWSVHDGEYMTFEDCTSNECGGGFITRGPFTRFIRPVVNGSHQDAFNGTMGNQSTLHGIHIGEPDVGQTTLAGRGGEGLVIEDACLNMRNDQSIVPSGIKVQDPLINARITGRTPIICYDTGLFVQTDVIDNTVIDLVVDGQVQSSGNMRGVDLELPGTSTAAAQYIRNSQIKVTTLGVQGRSLYIGDAKGTGSNDNNEFIVRTSAIGGAVTSGVPVVEFESVSGTNNNNTLKVNLPFSKITTAVKFAPPGTIFEKSRFLNGAVAESSRIANTPGTQLYLYPMRMTASTLSQAPTSGVVYFTEIEISDQRSWDELAWHVDQAEAVSAGTTIHLLGLYPDINGVPDLTNVVASGSVGVGATGNVLLNITAAPPPGKYWLASLYNTNGATVTTALLVTCITGVIGMAGGTVGTIYKCLQVTAGAQTALPTTQVALSRVGLATGNVPVVGLRSTT